jgi:uncharacterized coiled-coil DUF342 family protein
MNETNNEQMDRLSRLSEKQPDLYAQLPAQAKISLGIYESTKPTANNGLSSDELLRLRGLKQRIAEDVLSPSERISVALKISEMEKNINANK